MREVIVTVFQYGELSAKAKEVAANWYRECIDSSDYQSTEEDISQIVGMLGFDCDLSWSGFSSQGDGACLHGSWAAINCCFEQLKEYAPQDEVLQRISLELQAVVAADKEATAKLTHIGRYSHMYSVEIEYDSIADTDERVKEKFTIIARDLMQWAYGQLEKQDEFLHSEENIKDAMEANEYEFTADGKRWTRNGR